MTETHLAQAVDVAGPASTYDTNVKYLLADRQILARILKYTVKEFRDTPVAEIMNCIGSDIEVASVPVDPGMTNLGRVTESNTEDNVPGEGKIFFDIRFCAYHRQKEMKLLINIDYSDFGIIPIIPRFSFLCPHFSVENRNNSCT